jgi:hypothetical protein
MLTNACFASLTVCKLDSRVTCMLVDQQVSQSVVCVGLHTGKGPTGLSSGDIAPCSLYVNQRFGGTYQLNLQD